MLRINIKRNACEQLRAATADPDMMSKGLYFPLFKTVSCPEVTDIQSVRAASDFLSTSEHMYPGDTECSNLQVEALLSSALVSESKHSSYLDCDFDGNIDSWASHRQASSTVLTVVGTCEYSSQKDIAYVPPQNDFGWQTVKSTPYSGYTYTDRRVRRYTFVPFGKHWALVKTSYTITTYLPKYPMLSQASCSVTVWYVQFNRSSVDFSSYGPQTVMSASGSLSAIAAIVALADKRTSDPTSWAAGKLASLSPKDDSVPNPDYVHNSVYDPRAYLELNQGLAKTRIANLALLCCVNSQQLEPDYAIWADLADFAIDDCHFVDTNSISYLRDLRMVFSEVKSVYGVIHNPLSLKNWASAWLGFRFGTRLTAFDTKTIIDGTRRALTDELRTWTKKFQCVRSRKLTSIPVPLNLGTCDRALHYKVYYKPRNDTLSSALKLVTDMGLFPTTKNLWDLVPLSFVVDWAADVSDVLEKIDRRAYLQYLTVLGCTYSYKDEYIIRVPLSDLGFEDATCAVTWYSRRHRPTIHQSYLRLTAGHLSHVNVIDGISLIIQKIK